MSDGSDGFIDYRLIKNEAIIALIDEQVSKFQIPFNNTDLTITKGDPGYSIIVDLNQSTKAYVWHSGNTKKVYRGDIITPIMFKKATSIYDILKYCSGEIECPKSDIMILKSYFHEGDSEPTKYGDSYIITSRLYGLLELHKSDIVYYIVSPEGPNEHPYLVVERKENVENPRYIYRFSKNRYPPELVNAPAKRSFLRSVLNFFSFSSRNYNNI
jgi:hypothetical protein